MSKVKKRFEDLRATLTQNGTLIYPGTLLQRAAKLWPSRTALICEDLTITFKDLYTHAAIITKKLENLDVKPKDRVILIYENSINFYKAYYGSWQTGAIIVPLNVYLHEHELEHIIQDCTPKVIIASAKQKKKLEKLSLTTPIISEELFESDNNNSKVDDSATIPDRDPNECAAILYTSGTTGAPKGVMLSSRNILINSIQGIANFDITADERIYAALPLFHSLMQNAAVWSPFVVGATVIVVPGIMRKALLQGLKHKPTAVLGIPQLYGLFCLMKTAPFPNVKFFVSGGDALHNKIRMGFELIYQRKIANGYGLTETSPFVSVDLDDDRKASGCIGKPIIGVKAQIRDSGKQPLALGEEGVLWIKGENIMLGYYNAPAATIKVIENEWLNTGDLAYIDTNGAIVLCGRQKDLIIHKGFNIYPQEIENMLTTHPAVFMAGVVGHHFDDNEVPVAFVAVKDASENIVAELKALCARNLARYKIPVQFHIKKELPTTATGKVDKKVLRQELKKLVKKKNKQHILHIISSLQHGGAETLLVNLIEHMPEFNHTVLYFHDGPLKKPIERIGIQVYQVKGLLTRYDPWFFWHLIRLIKKINPDQILSSLWAANFFGRVAAKICTIPITCTLHTVIEHEGKLRRYLDRLLPIQPARYIAVSHNVAKSFNYKNITIIPNGVPEVQKKQTKNHCFTFGTVGRLVPVKNYDVLIKAFAQLHKEHPSSQLIIIGSGPKKEKLHKLITNFKLEKKIKLLGNQNAREHYHSFDCFVQPSQYEGLSLALLEALSAQLPVVVTGINHQHEVIKHNHNGLIIKPDSEKELYLALKKIMLNQKLQVQLKTNGYQTFSENYTIQQTAKNYSTILLS